MRMLLSGLLVASLVGGGSVAGEGSVAGVRQDGGVHAWYQGQVVSLDRIQELNHDGKARYSAHSFELTCHGIAAYFDTSEQEEVYGRGYRSRVKAVAEQRRALAPGTDPADADACAGWSSPIPGLPGL